MTPAQLFHELFPLIFIPSMGLLFIWVLRNEHII